MWFLQIVFLNLYVAVCAVLHAYIKLHLPNFIKVLTKGSALKVLKNYTARDHTLKRPILIAWCPAA